MSCNRESYRKYKTIHRTTLVTINRAFAFDIVTINSVFKSNTLFIVTRAINKLQDLPSEG